MRETIAGGIEAVDATSGADEQFTCHVFHEHPRCITREAISLAVPPDRGHCRSWVIDSAKPARGAGKPDASLTIGNNRPHRPESSWPLPRLWAWKRDFVELVAIPQQSALVETNPHSAEPILGQCVRE
jgi:hypothetical protein